MLNKSHKDGFNYKALTLRIGIGKVIGLIIGLIAFISLPLIAPESTIMLRWGFLLWYITLGAIIGVFGVYNYHPVLALPLPWWVRAPLIGGWMNLVLTFFAYDQFAYLMQIILNQNDGIERSILNSPFWFVAEGILAGFLIGWLTTKYAGEGKYAGESFKA